MRIADSFDHGRVQARAAGDKSLHPAVGPLHAAVGIHGDDGILHGVEKGLELTLAGLDGDETLFDLASGLIEGSGNLADLID